MDENQSIISLVQKCSLNSISPKSLVSTHLKKLRDKEGGREVKGADCPLKSIIITTFHKLIKQSLIYLDSLS